MRLAQLARKIQVKPSQLIDYLHTQFNLEVDKSPNSKISEDHVSKVLEYFLQTESENSESDNIQPEKEEIIVQTLNSDVTSDSDMSDDTNEVESESDLNIKDGIIKAPKIEIEGVKVVGKIELPEKKEKSEDETAEETVNEKPKRKKENHKRKRKRNKQISYEEKQKREQESYLEELKRKKEYEKRQKKLHYDQKMREIRKSTKKQVENKKRLKAENQEKIDSIDKSAENKTIWKKFIYWLNN